MSDGHCRMHWQGPTSTLLETCSDLASWMMEAILDWCSRHPGVAVIKGFWTDLSRYLLDSMNSSHLFFRMVVNSLPTQEVRAIGRKLEGSLGSSSADDFPISLIPARFQLVGMVDVDQQHWKRLSKAWVRDGHLLKTWYGIWSCRR